MFEFLEGPVPALLSLITTVISLGTFIAIVLVVFLAGRGSKVEKYLVLASLRRAKRTRIKALRGRYVWGQNSQRALHLTLLRSCYRATKEAIEAQIDGSRRTPYQLVISVCGSRMNKTSSDYALELHELLNKADSTGNQSLIAKWAWPETITEARQYYAQCAELLQRDWLNKTRYEAKIASLDQESFPYIVSEITGVRVLADGSQNRSGVIDSIRIRDTNVWNGPTDPHPYVRGKNLLIPSPNNVSSYEKYHRNSNTLELMLPGESEPISSKGKPGDYDGRIFSLRSAQFQRDTVSGVVTLYIETDDSCYSISEHGGKWACKHLESGKIPAPEFEISELDNAIFRKDERTMLLNTVIGLIARDKNGEASLVLSLRSNKATNAWDVISAAAGGVFENTRFGGVSDIDEYGCPDPRVSARREILEELGIEIELEKLAPISLYVSNVQGRPNKTWGNHNGQIVSSIAFLAECGMSLEEIKVAGATKSDWNTGRFEIDDFVEVPIPSPKANSEDERFLAATKFLQGVYKQIKQFDQVATLLSLYTSTHFYGETVTSKAVAKVFKKPWGEHTWSGVLTKHTRLVIPTEEFLKTSI